MSTITTIGGNDCAFPIIDPNNSQVIAYGMTMRQYYAGLILQGLAASPQSAPMAKCVKYAVEGADLLISELNKTQP